MKGCFAPSSHSFSANLTANNSVAQVIIFVCGWHSMGEKGTRMGSIIFVGLLEQHAKIWCIYLHSKPFVGSQNQSFSM